MTIWKFQLEVSDRQAVAMPLDAKVLSIQMQGPVLCLWALCDPTQPMVQRTVYIVGTGNPASDVLPDWYVGTVQMAGGRLVWHVFVGYP